MSAQESDPKDPPVSLIVGSFDLSNISKYFKDASSIYQSVIPALGEMMQTFQFTPSDKVINFPVPENLFPNNPIPHRHLERIMRHLVSSGSKSTNVIKFEIYKTCGATLMPEFDPKIHEYLWEIYEDVADRTPTDYYFTINFVVREIVNPQLRKYIRYTDGAEEGYARQVINSMLHQGYLKDHGWLAGSD